MDNSFAHLAQINVNDHLERKGEFVYLSWPYAVQQLRLADPTACWEVRRFDGLPYLKTELGFFVEVAVTVQGVTLSQIHPVLDADNRPIPDRPASTSTPPSHGAWSRPSLCTAWVCTSMPARTCQAGTRLRPSPPVSELRPQSRATTAQLRYIRRLVEETGTDLAKILEYFDVSTLGQLNGRQASRAIKSLEKTRRAA